MKFLLYSNLIWNVESLMLICQYTSKAFLEFCNSVPMSQSMVKTGYPYENAPLRRSKTDTSICMNFRQKNKIPDCLITQHRSCLFLL